MSLYSKIYSCKSDNFISKNAYTLEGRKEAEKVCGESFTGIFDRGYDDNKIFKYMSDHKHKFVIRLDDERTLLFKGKKRSVGEVSKTRKGKISYKALFNDNEEYELMLSYTKATLPYNKKEYTLVIVYGLSEEKPMKLWVNHFFCGKWEYIKKYKQVKVRYKKSKKLTYNIS